MADLNAIFHHVVLPPTLPSAPDADPLSVGNALLQRLVRACHALQTATESSPHAAAGNGMITALGLWSGVYGEHVGSGQYRAALQSVLSTENQVLACYIMEQNAALLVYCRDEHVVFEAFEASPQSQHVLASRNALLWNFPSHAASLPQAELAQDEHLQQALAAFLSKATSEHLSLFSNTVEKAGISVSESRNPGSPALITHMLLSVIEALGTHAPVPVLKKRVRDDVQFQSGRGGTGPRPGPWRRHPLWLVLRVAVRRQLELALGAAAGHAAYKILLTTVTAHLLRDAVAERAEVVTVDLLLKKACRRLAKLDKLPTPEGVPWRLGDAPVKALFQDTVSSAREYIRTEFHNFQLCSVRRVPRLPQRVDVNSDSLRLTLPNSLSYLEELSVRHVRPPQWLPTSWQAGNTGDGDLDRRLAKNLNDNPAVVRARDTYNEVYSLLSGLHKATEEAGTLVRDHEGGEEEPGPRCQKLSSILDSLLRSLPPLSSDDPELNSQVCLTLFSLWTVMDVAATEAFPMLRDYQPPFTPEILNVLQLPRLRDMGCVRQIQRHVGHRCQNASCRGRSIFGPLDQHCFGARFAQASPTMMECLQHIRETERQRREDKRVEWEAICENYTRLSDEMSPLACCCIFDADGKRNVDGCGHCFLGRERWRLQIKTCEDLLPQDEHLAAAIVFELNMPAAFAAYRNTTWTLLRQLAYPVQPAPSQKARTLANNKDLETLFPTLPAFHTTHGNGPAPSVCLASPKKAFAQTHYQQLRMWVDLEELLVPHGSTFTLYDAGARTWVSSFNMPFTLAHLSRISIPGQLKHVFPRPAHPPPDPEGPSSYEAVAHRSQCPGDMSPHEFEAYHYLLAGRARRWLTLLVELGSSNLNFSKDDTLLTCTHLVQEVGPEEATAAATTQETNETDSSGCTDHRLALGTCHAIFLDGRFVDRLLDAIQQRMDTIRSSWRESNGMDLVITLALAVYVRASEAGQRQRAKDIVQAARAAVLRWIDALRTESEKSAAASSSGPRYSFRAALVGRHTFALFAPDHTPPCDPLTTVAMGPAEVTDYLKLSVALQQNRVVDMDRLSPMDRIMLRRDAALAVEIQALILDAAVEHPQAVGEAVVYSIGKAVDVGATTMLVSPKIHRDRHYGWLTAVLTSTASGPQQVDLDCLEGHLLIDGKTLRKLPDDIRDSKDVKELFGQQHMLTYPSKVPGAVCRLVAPVEGFVVHFGRHNGTPVVMAESRNGSISDFVPRRVFMNETEDQYDLPRGLVDDCVHWYDRNTRTVEICRKPDIWKSKESHWKLHVPTRQVQRRNVLLVDPHAPVCSTVAAIFRHFEDPQRLTVYQPIKVLRYGKTAPLKVELRHLDLSFSVNHRGILECSELSAEIDPDQDAGTLYGYDSMIVMRELGNHSRRSIIAPRGPLMWSRRGVHVSLRTNIGSASSYGNRSKYTVSAKDKAYVRFTIDPVLGRLVCPPEPLMLYIKAQLHAFTSFSPLPDPLTGRTGEEEATATLLSGRCQPWEPLNHLSTRVLYQIRQLCPERSFYPKDKRVLQQVSWDSFLPTGMQNDRYGHLVDRILKQSEALKPFRDGWEQETPPEIPPAITDNSSGNGDGRADLHIRAQVQRLRFEAPHAHKEITQDTNIPQNFDVKYRSLGQSARFKVAGVQEITRALRGGNVLPTANLSVVLERWSRIGGQDGQHLLQKNLGEMPLAELVASHTMNEHWGSLVYVCSRADSAQAAEMIMALAVMAFSPSADLDAVRWLATYFCTPQLKDVRFPRIGVFSGFKFNQVPTQEYVEALLCGAYPPFAYTKATLWSEGRSDLEEEQSKHLALCAKEGAVLAGKIMLHWPDDICGMSSANDESPSDVKAIIDTDLAVEKIEPEWQRLRANWQLSQHIEEVNRIVGLQGAFVQPIEPAPEAGKRRGRGRPEDDGCLRGRQNAPCNVVPRLDQGLARRDMRWTPSQTLLRMHTVHPGKSKDESSTSERQTGVTQYKPTAEEMQLGQLIGHFKRYSKKTSNELRMQYSNNLDSSLGALKRLHLQQLQQQQQRRTDDTDDLACTSSAKTEQQARTAQRTVRAFYQAICSSFKDLSDGSWLEQAGLWPRLTPTTILELLQSTANPPVMWGRLARETVVNYGCALAEWQRLQRILRALDKGDRQRAGDETRNPGHTNWQPGDHADWLLLEVDSDVMIRAQQVDVARALLAPDSQANAVLQLNMGQGKTSCIVPMAMAVLADGRQLARLVVPKALLRPTAQMIQSRLGGLVGRQVRQLAFSRRLLSRPNIDTVLRIYEAHHNDLLRLRGILLVAPEHLLAFKLCGLQCLADCEEQARKRKTQKAQQEQQCQGVRGHGERARLALARRMLALQDRLSSDLCRDVLDESDVILSQRTQLVYPSGAQTAVDGAPQRWKLAQVLLAIVEDQLPDLCRRFPQSIGSVPRGGEDGHGFPMVQISQMEHIQEPLHAAAIEALSKGQAMAFGAWAPGTSGVADREKQRYLHDALQNDSTAAAVDAAAGLFADAGTARNGLLLVRGLLSHRILLVCLRKRWNVQYGLHPNRWPIAVPYEARGVPSDRSEFGHPDVAILLTCLAFYYSGLNRDQLRSGLRHILCHHDDPVTAYAHWTAGATSGAGSASVPPDLQQWNVVNPDDDSQVEQLWRCLRMTRPVIDHYLDTFVFPAHARQFSVKLQASAWDVPLGERKTNRTHANKARTTGFSGTNDNRAMLPLTIKQLDLPGLVHTNADVLTYLLQDRNRGYRCCVDPAADAFGQSHPAGAVARRWSEDQLLEDLKKREIRVLIDAGAYVLERDNQSVARAWLKIDHKAPAAVFFGTDNRPWVLFRDATAGCVPLIATPFDDERRLGECLVYLDEAHTRGVDLRLPTDCRGGLTLALGQTKDHTVQAAMRLRQLGTTQSVLWYAPPEVDRSIRHVWQTVTNTPLPCPPPGGVQSQHVLLWLLEQTCAANEQLHPLYLSHGYDFCRRSRAEKRYRQYVRPDEATDVHEEDVDADNGKEDRTEDAPEYGWRRVIDESIRKTRKELVDTLQQPERMTLDQLYGWPNKEGAKEAVAANSAPAAPAAVKPARGQSGLARIFQQLRDQGFDHSRKITTAAFEEVEQEREVEVQVEQVRAKKAQVHFDALNFPGRLHWAIESFLASGGALPRGHGLHQVFSFVARSEVGRRHHVGVSGTASALYVSVEFTRSTQQKPRQDVRTRRNGRGPPSAEHNADRSSHLPTAPADDQFVRPLQWLLWSRRTNTAVAVVPEEAELLLRRLRRGTTTTTDIHLLVYAAAVTRAMVGLSSGTYYSVPSLPSDYSLPPWLTIEAGILGGRLYMSFRESQAMRAYLEEHAVAAAAAEMQGSTGSRSRTHLCPNLSSFLLDWLPLRRVGQDITHTPAAYICQGRPLHEDHAFFVR